MVLIVFGFVVNGRGCAVLEANGEHLSKDCSQKADAKDDNDYLLRA